MTLRPAETLVGRIVGVFGVHGELKCDPTSAGRPLFTPGRELRCACDGTELTIRLTAVRSHKGRLLVRIEGVEDPVAAARYADSKLYASRSEIALGKDEYLDDDLVGCDVFGRDGMRYGAVERVEHYPSSDMLLVGDRMVPMVRAIVTEIDTAQRRIVIDPPGGLFD